MANVSDDSRFKNGAGDGDQQSNNEHAQALTWALVDEQISDDEMRMLDYLLLSNDGARDTYIACMQLHSDLVHFYGDSTTEESPNPATKQPPVLGFLSDSSSLTAFPPRAEDSHA